MGSTGGKSAKNTSAQQSVTNAIALGQDDDLGQVNTVNTGSQAQQANAQAFSDTDDGDFKDFRGGRKYYQKQTFSIDTEIALQDYKYPEAVDNTLYSPSQNMNYKMKTGKNLTAQEMFMRDSLLDGMHNLGYNMNLQRYGRNEYLDDFGKLAVQQGLTNLKITKDNFDQFTEAQLKKAFIGLEYGESSFVSASYNKFARALNSGKPFTDKTVKMEIKAPASAQALMPGTFKQKVNGTMQTNDLGEIVLAPNQRYRITNVRFTGQMGRTENTYQKQIEFEVEIF